MDETLLTALREERDVRLAVLFGSTATGQDTPDSDLDLLVELRSGGPLELAGVRRRLAESHVTSWLAWQVNKRPS